MSSSVSCACFASGRIDRGISAACRTPTSGVGRASFAAGKPGRSSDTARSAAQGDHVNLKSRASLMFRWVQWECIILEAYRGVTMRKKDIEDKDKSWQILVKPCKSSELLFTLLFIIVHRAGVQSES